MIKHGRARLCPCGARFSVPAGLLSPATYSATFTGIGSTAVKATAKAYSVMPYSGSLTIGPYSLMVLSQQ